MQIQKIINLSKDLNWEEAIRYALKDASFKVHSIQLKNFQAILEGEPQVS